MTDTIKELIAAGEKVRADEFYCDTGDEVQNDAGCVFAYPKDEMFKDTNFANNSEFFVIAANARPAIKAMHETIKLLEADKERMIEKLGEILTIAADADDDVIAELAREGLGA